MSAPPENRWEMTKHVDGCAQPGESDRNTRTLDPGSIKDFVADNACLALIVWGVQGAFQVRGVERVQQVEGSENSRRKR